MHRFEAELWEWDGQAAWHFLSLPPELGRELREQTDGTAGGLGSIPVLVTVGETTWETSVFPDTARGSYLLPVKKAVRRGEDLLVGDVVEVALDLR